MRREAVLRGRHNGGLLPPFRAASLLLLLALSAGALIASGCSNSESVHPALRLEEEDYKKAVERARGLVTSRSDPARAYKTGMQQVNLRVGQDVIIREAAVCWPAEELAYLIVKNSADGTAVDRVAKQARRTVETDLKIEVVMQLPKAQDPSSLTFALKTSAGEEYPPLSVEPPIFIRDVASALDPTMPASAMYSYDVHFPIQGSPGFPPIGPGVTSLDLIVKDGTLQAAASFAMPTQIRRY